MRPGVFLPRLAVLLVAGCGFAEDGSSSSAGSGGAGSSAGETSGTSGSGMGGASGTSSSGMPGSGGGGSASCGDLMECGNVGVGCIHCAIESTCVAPFMACFNDVECSKYTSCVDGCDMKGADCLSACEQQFPGGVPLFQALAQCALCEVCAGTCAPPPGGCMP